MFMTGKQVRKRSFRRGGRPKRVGDKGREGEKNQGWSRDWIEIEREGEESTIRKRTETPVKES